MSIGHQFSQGSWGPNSTSKSQKLSHEMKTALAGAVPISVGIWPVIISGLVAGPIGLLVSGAITLGIAGVSSGVTYAVTEDD